ncbi:MAG TPA: cytochrome P450, partial [Paracoccaceae bacterium]|nr:cytochrome P450 [Paracoccaceae bacterium]
MNTPAKPTHRPGSAGILARIRLFRSDALSSQPERLYTARMAETRTPFYRSFLVNEPDLAAEILRDVNSFPKAGVLGQTLRVLLGNSLFVSNSADWARHRRILEPIFKDAAALTPALPVIKQAVATMVVRLTQFGETPDVEAETSRFAADVMFRLLLSRPIESPEALALFQAFQQYQRAQPLWQPAALLRLPRWMRRGPNRAARLAAAQILEPLAKIISKRRQDIQEGTAPNDMLGQMMRAVDVETGIALNDQELLDQLAIFLLAGHETSASALSWALYLLALNPTYQEQLSEEARSADSLRKLK